MRITKERRICVFFLCCMLFLSSLSITAFGGLKRLEFKNGEIEMEFEDKKATTGTIYHTIGWIIHKSSQSGLDAYNKEKVGVMIGADYEETKSQDMPNGNVLTKFNVDFDAVNQALLKAGLGEVKDGETVYLDSIFEVVRNGAGSGQYNTYSQISSAAPWSSASMENLKAYYNIPVTYYSSTKHPVYKEVIVNGKTISKTKVTEGKTGTTPNIKLDSSVSYNGGIAQITKSYFYYELAKGEKLFEVKAPDTKVTDRNPTIPAGGITVVAEYEIAPILKVEHVDLDTGVVMEKSEREVHNGETISESSKTFPGKSYLYSEISDNGGGTWKLRSDKTTRNVIVNDNTVIRFYYSAKTDLIAILNLTADPSAIESGKKETVKFTLDASASKAKAGIKQYEFWFGPDTNFAEKPDYTVTTAVKIVSQPDVPPDTTWYGKVRITDAKGNTAEATAEVYIEELIPEPKVEIKPNLKLKIVQDTPIIAAWHDDYNYGWGVDQGVVQDGIHIWYGMDVYMVDIKVPNDKVDEPVKLRFTMDASESESTNGLGNFRFRDDLNDRTIQDGGSPVTIPYEITLPITPQDVKNGKYNNDYYDTDFPTSCIMSDSVVTTEKAKLNVTLRYKYIFEKEPPNVTLAISAHDFGLGETAHFTPGFIQNENTYAITDKSWTLYSEAGVCLEDKNGEITRDYILNLAEGTYIARQYIYYRDDDGNDKEAYAEVNFHVWAMRPPDVTIKCDKEKYVAPETGIFTTEFFEEPKYSYQIVDRDYKLKLENGEAIIAEGSGKFPDTFFFDEEMDGGYYIAEQTIYWWQEGEYKSKTASCKFKVISPKPVAAFEVKMKMSSTAEDWLRIDLPDKSGKQYKQIRIDLTPSIALNQELENPFPIDFSSSNTQIQLIPLNEEGKPDYEKNQLIYTPVASDIQLENDVITFKGKQFIDVRFDNFGVFKVRCRVVNAQYIGGWMERNIVIRPELPPVVDLSLVEVLDEAGVNKVYRNTNDLHVRFGINIEATQQDEDQIDPNSAKLNIRFDYNANNDASDDGVHSEMIVTNGANNVQPYVNVTKDASMNNFKLDLYSPDFPILGKMRFEYSVSEIPLIPNFANSSMPPIPEMRGTTELVPIEKKILYADNHPGNIKVDIGKNSKIEITVILGRDTPSFDLNALRDYYGDEAVIYVIDKNGNRQLYN